MTTVRLVLLALLVSAVAVLGAGNVRAEPGRNGHRDPVELWHSFPLGPKARQKDRLGGGAVVGPDVSRSAHPPVAAVTVPAGRGSSFPLTLVVALTGFAGMAGVVFVAVLRSRRKPRGSAAVVGEPPPRPFGAYSVLRVWHSDVEGRFRRVDPDEQERREASARHEFRQRLLISVASAQQTWDRFVMEHPERRTEPAEERPSETRRPAGEADPRGSDTRKLDF